MFKDSRRFERLSLNTAVKFRRYSDYDRRAFADDKEIEAVALDIGEGGIGLQSGIMVVVKTYLQMTISLSSLNKEGEVIFYGPLCVNGKVRWVVPWDDHTFRMGISFLDMSEEERKGIQDFINGHVGIKEKIIHPHDASSGTVLGGNK